MVFTKYIELLKEIKDLLSSDPEAVEHIHNLTEKIKSLKEEDHLHSKEMKKSSKFFHPESFPIPDGPVEFSSSDLLLFCDGACRGNPGPGSWAAMGQHTDGSIFFEASGVEVPTTNNKMELLGASQALKLAYEHLKETQVTGPVRVYLFTDSKYVVEGMNSWIIKWKERGWKKADNKDPENLDYWKELDQVQNLFPSVGFVWVKGHNGHPQNEYVDMLANKALDEAGH